MTAQKQRFFTAMCALWIVIGMTTSAFAQEAAPKGLPMPSDGFSSDIQYRLRSVRIDPLEINGTNVTKMNWTEQRLRLNARYIQAGIGSVNIQLDALDGVLFGDNGRFLGNPTSNSGVSLSSRRPNLTRWRVGLPAGGDAVEKKDYAPVLAAVDPVEVNYAYADILLPIGLLRVGRQPLAYGPNLAAHDGGDYNRFGISQFSDAADRILFGTKLDEGYYAITKGKDHIPNTSLDSGLVFAMFYDFLKQDVPHVGNDDLRQMGGTIEYRRGQANWFGLDWRDMVLGLRLVHLRNDRFNSRLWSFPTLLKMSVEKLDLQMQYVHIRGETKEISEGFGGLTNSAVVDQQLRAHGFQALVDYSLGPVTFTLEFDYASGDDDPRPSTPITSYNYARDLNVGLLMFEHILAFESARSTAVGIENLEGKETASFPLTEVSTEGRFTNAVAVFPQLFVRYVDNDNHKLWSRFGVLMAWPQAAGGVVDPIITSLNEDGDRIDDDAVNFHGGKPGDYYGTEIDIQLGWKYKKHFEWVVEGAYLFPGSSLQDANGDAVNSYLLENRFVFNF